MTLLSRKADYALLILSHLYQKREGGNARAIAEKFGLSRSFVANILKELCQKGFVDSHRGVKGGYALARPAHTISLAELLESLEDGFRLTMCNENSQTQGGTCTHSEVCTVKGAITEVHHRLIEVLRGVSLAEVFDPTIPKSQPLSALPMVKSESCCTKPLAASP